MSSEITVIRGTILRVDCRKKYDGGEVLRGDEMEIGGRGYEPCCSRDGLSTVRSEMGARPHCDEAYVTMRLTTRWRSAT